MGVGGDQLDPGQTTRGQITEEAQPAGAVLGRGDLQPEDFAVPVAVDTGREQGVHVNHPPALTDLEHQRVRGYERVRAMNPIPPRCPASRCVAPRLAPPGSVLRWADGRASTTDWASVDGLVAAWSTATR